MAWMRIVAVLVACHLCGIHAEDITSLQQAFVIFRHGERTPLMTYPTDPYQHNWTPGLGQLTNNGKKQAFSLGQYIKQRYRGFISDNFNKKELITLSSTMDRSFATALTVLAGLYPPVGEEVWKLDLPWQPLPVITTPEKTNWLFMTGYCPKYDDIVLNFLNTEELKNFTKERESLMQYLTQETGVSLNTLNLLDRYYDVLEALKAMHLSFPAFVNSSIYSELEEVHKMTNSLYANTDEQKTMKVGPILENMRGFMEQSSQNETESKLILYSGNDRLITTLLAALNTSDIGDPSFTAALYIQLHRTPNDNFSVKMFFQESRNASPVEMSIPSCPAPCSLDQFNTTISSFIPDNNIEECGVPFEKLKTFWKMGDEASLSLSKYL